MIPRSSNIKVFTAASLILGLATIVTNLLAYLIAPDLLIPVGNVFVFWGAAALGLPGSMIVFTIGVAPEVIASGDLAYGGRILALTIAIALTVKRFPACPPFLTASALWLFVFAPVLLYQNWQISMSHSPSAIMLAALSEILLVVISSTMLLNNGLLGSINQRPQQITAFRFLLHALPLFATLALVVCMTFVFSFNENLGNRSLYVNLMTLSTLLTLAVFLPALGAYGLAKYLKNNTSDLFAGNIIPNSSSAKFSGLNSQYWRQKSEPPATNTPREQWDNVPCRSESEPDIANGVCALTKNGTVIYLNNKFKRLLNITQNNVVGKKITQLGLTPRVNEHLLDLLDKTFVSGPRTTELKLNELPEKLRYFEISSRFSNGHEEDSEKQQEIIITARDITSLRTVESHLLKAQRLGSLGSLVANFAHSFNNTLTAISGYANFAAQTNKESEVKMNLDRIMRATQEAEDYIKQMLDFASDDHPSILSNRSLNTLIDEHLDLLKKMAGSQYPLDFNQPEDAVVISCDSKLILQAITNLILNARESYAEKSGGIHITLDTEYIDEDVSFFHVGACKGNYARLQIKDHGFGMSEDILENAFNPLFTTKAERGNTGLGLSIVFSIVRAHDGFLTMESHPGKGSTVSLFFPVAKENVEPVQSNSEHTKQSRPEKKTLYGMKESILVVEDEESVRDLVTTMLTKLNYEVTSCSDGEEALEYCTRNKFDLVLVDMVMPKMNGQTLLEKMKHLGSQGKTLIMTGYGVLPGLEKKGDSGVVISKPFDIETLALAVKSVLKEENRDS